MSSLLLRLLADMLFSNHSASLFLHPRKGQQKCTSRFIAGEFEELPLHRLLEHNPRLIMMKNRSLDTVISKEITMFLQFAKLYRDLSEQSQDEQDLEECVMLAQEAADIENFFMQYRSDSATEELIAPQIQAHNPVMEEEAEEEMLAQERNLIAKWLQDQRSREPVEVGAESQEIVNEAIHYLEDVWWNRSVSDVESPFVEPANNLVEDANNKGIQTLINLLRMVPHKSYNFLGSSPPDEIVQLVFHRILRSQCSEIAMGSDLSSEIPFSLDNVVIGNHNRPVQTIVEKSFDDPSSFFNPLIIYGSTGLGKTTLLKSIGTMYSKRGFSVFYCSSNQFIDDFASTRGGLDELLMCVYKKVDVLLFDDLQSLSKKKKAQKRFSVLLEYLIEHGRRVIVTSECLPVHMKLEECLIKQLDVGVPIPVEPPDVETKVNLLRAMTSSSCQFLSEDMLRKIAERVESNIRDLKGAVKFVSAQMEMDERSDVVSAVEKWQRQRQQKGVIKQVKRGSESKFQSPLPIAV